MHRFHVCGTKEVEVLLAETPLLYRCLGAAKFERALLCVMQKWVEHATARLVVAGEATAHKS